MKLLGTFLCLSLIHLCHCAGDGDGKGAAKNGSDQTSGENTRNGRGGQYNVSQDGVQPANPAVKDVKMDISKIDGTMFTIQESTDGKVPTKTLTPKDGNRVTEVTEGETVIWKTVDPKEHVKSVVIHYDGESPILAAVTFLRTDDKTARRSYIKQDDGTWKFVNRDVLESKLDGMKEGHRGDSKTPQTGAKATTPTASQGNKEHATPQSTSQPSAPTGESGSLQDAEKEGSTGTDKPSKNLSTNSSSGDSTKPSQD